MKVRILAVGLLLFGVGCQSINRRSIPENGPYQTTGIKITEVDQTSATIWTRLCSTPERVHAPGSFPNISYLKEKDGKELGWPDQVPVVTYPEGLNINTIDGAVPGTTEEVQVWYRVKQEDPWKKTRWTPVAPNAGFTASVRLNSLMPGKNYQLKVHCRKDERAPEGEMVAGNFRTAPAAKADVPVSFMVVTGQSYGNRDKPGYGYYSYGSMLKLNPDFFVHTGDIVYYGKYAKNLPLAYYHWDRMYSLPSNADFHKRVSSYFIKDDHDTLCNDTWRGCRRNARMGAFTFDDGVRLFKEQTGIRGKTYRTFRWGKHLQVWLVEGRDYRSSNKAPDGPEKTIWGAEQKAWFKKTVQESDATFRVLISPTPIIGPDRVGKCDNHANAAWATEGNEIRSFLATQKDMVVICGDRHWQYVSKDPKTGTFEYSCGPLSDKHAGGWKEGQLSEHLYLNICGGFLNGRVEIRNSKPVLVLRHLSPEGKILNESVNHADLSG